MLAIHESGLHYAVQPALGEVCSRAECEGVAVASGAESHAQPKHLQRKLSARTTLSFLTLRYHF
jgi:hypothetical protein